jgi:hypothetical protein
MRFTSVLGVAQANIVLDGEKGGGSGPEKENKQGAYMKAWTERGGELTREDKDVIGSIGRKSEGASQIFLIGEIFGQRLTGEEEGLLMAANDLLGEPLFIRTKENTVSMVRFSPREVWPLLNPDLVERMVEREAARFGIEGLSLDDWDFCYALVKHIKIQCGELQTPTTLKRDHNSFYQIMYLSALVMFEKPGFMGVPVYRHFALPEAEEFARTAMSRPLETAETDELIELQEKYGKYAGLSNRELRFLLGLYDASRKVPVK